MELVIDGPEGEALWDVYQEGQDSVTEEDDEEMERREDVVTERAFVVAEMLRLTALCDFSDEIGRRKAFAVVREYCQPLYGGC